MKNVKRVVLGTYEVRRSDVDCEGAVVHCAVGQDVKIPKRLFGERIRLVAEIIDAPRPKRGGEGRAEA